MARNLLVMVLVDDGGHEVNDGLWHLDDPAAAGVAGQVFCTGEVYGHAESGVVFNT